MQPTTPLRAQGIVHVRKVTYIHMSFHFKINQPANISYPTFVFLCVICFLLIILICFLLDTPKIRSGTQICFWRGKYIKESKSGAEEGPHVNQRVKSIWRVQLSVADHFFLRIIIHIPSLSPPIQIFLWV